jgi:hypothetical protein
MPGSTPSPSTPIPDVSNTLSKWLLDTPALVQQAESLSRQRGEHLLALLNKEADDEGVEIRTAAVAPPIAMLGDVAASRARYYLLHMARREDKVLTTLALVHAGWPDVVESRLPGIHDRSGDLAMNGIR